MKAINGKWRRFGGMGLDAVSLSALVLPFGLEPERVRVRKGRREQTRGYKGRAVAKAWALVKGGM